MRKTNKKFLIPALSVGALVLAGAAVGAINTMTASAASTDITVSAASVRYVDSNYVAGVRFQILLNKSAYTEGSTEIGAKMIPAYYLGSDTIEETTSDKLVSTKAIEFNEAYSDTQVEAIVYVYNIPAVNYGTDLKIAAYATTDEATVYSEEVTCTLAEVAQASVENDSSLKEGLKGYYTFDVDIDGTTSKEVYGDTLDKPVASETCVVWKNEAGTATWDFDKMTVAGNTKLVKHASNIHTPEADDGDAATPTKCSVCGENAFTNEPYLLLDVSSTADVETKVSQTPGKHYGETMIVKTFEANQTFEDKNVLEITLKSNAEINNAGTAMTLDITFNLGDLSGYDYVTFDFYTTLVKDYLELRNDNKECGFNLKDIVKKTGTWYTIKIPAQTLQDYPSLISTSARGETFYFTNFVGYNAEIVQNMIDDLPEAANVQESDRVAIEEARKVYEALSDTAKAKVDTAKLVACEGALTQPVVLLDVSNTADVETKVRQTAGEHYGETMIVKTFEANQTFEDKNVLEITLKSNAEINNAGTAMTLDITFNLGDLSGYDYVTFDFYTTCVGSHLELRNDSGQTGLNLKSEYNMQSRTWYTVKIPAETLQQYPSLISTSARGETFYFTNFVAY